MGSRVVPAGVHAVMAIDPGGTTGVAAGHFKLHHTLKQTLLEGKRMHKTVEVKGAWDDQVAELARLFIKFRFTAQSEHWLPLENVHLAVEDYQRRPTASSSNLTSIWVAAGLSILVSELVEVTWQQPSDAKGKATNERLRLWDLWAVGSDHERDANRHLALRLDRLISGK